MTPAPAARHRTRLQIGLLALLFFAPFFGAYLAVFGFGWQPEGGGRLNYGQLVHPARPVPVFSLRDPDGRLHATDALRGKWTYLHRLSGPCADECRRGLVLSRQVRQAMNTDRERVRRVLLIADGVDLAALDAELAGEHPDLLRLREAEQGALARDFFADAPPQALLLIDPNGNWLMWYPPTAASQEAVQQDFKGLQKDLRKLLRLSSMG